MEKTVCPECLIKDKIIEELLGRTLTIGDIRILPDEDRHRYYRKRGLDEVEIILADNVIIEQLRGQDLYDAMYYQMAVKTVKLWRQKIFRKLGIPYEMKFTKKLEK